MCGRSAYFFDPRSILRYRIFLLQYAFRAGQSQRNGSRFSGLSRKSIAPCTQLFFCFSLFYLDHLFYGNRPLPWLCCFYRLVFQCFTNSVFIAGCCPALLIWYCAFKHNQLFSFDPRTDLCGRVYRQLVLRLYLRRVYADFPVFPRLTKGYLFVARHLRYCLGTKSCSPRSFS